jgi:hypothetical protein
VAQGSVSGHVTLADVHAPARGARIMVLPLAAIGAAEDQPEGMADAMPHMGTTGLDGGFTVAHIPAGDYVVLAFTAGYLSPLDGVEMPVAESAEEQKTYMKLLRDIAPTVRVSGQQTTRLDLELQRGAVLTGRVLYSDGAPATQLHVVLQNAKDQTDDEKAKRMADVGSMFRTTLLMQNSATDEQGHFRIAGIAPGTYRLAIPQTFEASQSFGDEMMEAFYANQRDTRKLTIYSGSTLHRKDAKTYALKAGETVDGVEITLPLTGLHSVHGIAAGKDGVPLNSGVLDLTDTSDPAISFHTTIGAEGEFRFGGVPEGEYQLKATDGQILENRHVPDDAQQDALVPTAIRAFAETTIRVIVQTTDIDNLTLTLADTKLPDPPKFPPIDGVDQAVGPPPR